MTRLQSALPRQPGDRHGPHSCQRTARLQKAEAASRHPAVLATSRPGSFLGAPVTYQNAHPTAPACPTTAYGCPGWPVKSPPLRLSAPPHLSATPPTSLPPPPQPPPRPVAMAAAAVATAAASASRTSCPLPQPQPQKIDRLGLQKKRERRPRRPWQVPPCRPGGEGRRPATAGHASRRPDRRRVPSNLAQQPPRLLPPHRGPEACLSPIWSIPSRVVVPMRNNNSVNKWIGSHGTAMLSRLDWRPQLGPRHGAWLFHDSPPFSQLRAWAAAERLARNRN